VSEASTRRLSQRWRSGQDSLVLLDFLGSSSSQSRFVSLRHNRSGFPDLQVTCRNRPGNEDVAIRIFRRLLLLTLLLAGVLGVAAGLWPWSAWRVGVRQAGTITKRRSIACAVPGKPCAQTTRTKPTKSAWFWSRRLQGPCQPAARRRAISPAKPYAETGKMDVAGPVLNHA